MSNRGWAEWVQDMLDAIREIQHSVQGADAASFEASPVLVKAVMANFIIIGEAAAQLGDESQTPIHNCPFEKPNG